MFVATLDGRLIALDAATGRKRWEQLTIDPAKPYTITGAPRVVKGKVLICNAPVVEGAVVAATEAAGGSSVELVRQTAEEYSAR